MLKEVLPREMLDAEGEFQVLGTPPPSLSPSLQN